MSAKMAPQLVGSCLSWAPGVRLGTNETRQNDGGYASQRRWETCHKKVAGFSRVYVDIDAQDVQEFNEWYNKEHLPELLSVPGILSAARYEAVEGWPANPWHAMNWKAWR